ncbi:MAG: 2-oxoacid:acceptor oxidoreductase subunit alpha [Candidatus Omnitrophica bacterium]|nr:2-oxoacid:acceptor oxidoreductase subunit alpha [Candidatus Omnitrophota bacterium]
MNEVSFLIGGKAGFGIDKSGTVIAGILNRMGYRIYIYRDYPSLIRGGHTFSIIRASKTRVACHLNKVDIILALNQDTFNFHKARLKEDSLIISDSDVVKIEGVSNRVIGIPITGMVKEENAAEIMRNTCVIGALCKAAGISWDILDEIFRKEFTKEIDINLKIARRGFDAAREEKRIEGLGQAPLAMLTGNQAAGLGLIRGGLKTYISYPMTPSSPILHFLAEMAPDFGLKVIHPESEIGVVLMALGASYMGERVAVGTSGGGFCLMTEGLSFSGMSELPVVFIVGQRPGPSTGLPTYSAQTELHFVLNAGQGEFVRLVVAPADPEEAYYWSAVSLALSQKYQIPGIILTDKNMGEGTFNFDLSSMGEIREEPPLLWDRKSEYKRYLDTENGVSPLAFVPDRNAIVKVNSYEHDEYGITAEDQQITTRMNDKRLRKATYLAKDLEGYPCVKTYGNKDSSTVLLCWGSNKGVCVEAAERSGLKVVQPLVLWPFPVKQFQDALQGVKKLICVENNATGQLTRLLKAQGFGTDKQILKYDGRPFSLDELQERLSGV